MVTLAQGVLGLMFLHCLKHCSLCLNQSLGFVFTYSHYFLQVSVKTIMDV